MSDKKQAKYCPVELAMQLISRKWIIQLLRDMFFGKTRFNEFKEDKPHLSNKVLSNCLKEMEENGLILKETNDNNSQYLLTWKGKQLNKVIYELAMFTLNTDLDNDYYSENEKEELRIIFKEILLKN